MSCALSSSRNLSSPTLESKENPYLAHAVEKYHKIGKNHGNLKSRKNVNQLQTVAKKSNFGPRCRPKTKLKAGFMIFRTGSSNLMRKKIKLVLRMTKEPTITYTITKLFLVWTQVVPSLVTPGRTENSIISSRRNVLLGCTECAVRALSEKVRGGCVHSL